MTKLNIAQLRKALATVPQWKKRAAAITRQLVYQEAFRSVGKALAREYALKQLTRVQKVALIAGAQRRRPGAFLV
jgi:predicted GIY-YIG superfamily endonuclease